jgi:outer membrane immunogenic protein
MHKLLGLVLLIGISSSAQQATLPSSVKPAEQDGPLELSLNYDYARANAGPGQCGCFTMNGGSTEVAFHAWRGFSAVADLTGERASSIGATGGDGLSLVFFTVGPRYTFRFRGEKLSHYSTFAQGLVGAAHGFDSLFPASNGSLAGAANSLAVLAGGGLDIPMSRYIAIRAFQADYLRTQLPNNASDEQNSLRLGAGVVLHAW